MSLLQLIASVSFFFFIFFFAFFSTFCCCRTLRKNCKYGNTALLCFALLCCCNWFLQLASSSSSSWFSSPHLLLHNTKKKTANMEHTLQKESANFAKCAAGELSFCIPFFLAYAHTLWCTLYYIYQSIRGSNLCGLASQMGWANCRSWAWQ